MQEATSSRTLAQIEADLLTAEASYNDAVARLRDAERDLRSALETINKHQGEIDGAIESLRQRSPEGSSWRGPTGANKAALPLPKASPAEEVLVLKDEAESEPAAELERPKFPTGTRKAEIMFKANSPAEFKVLRRKEPPVASLVRDTDAP
jgi:hypothetical protein